MGAAAIVEAAGRHWREIPARVYGTDSDAVSLSWARSGLFRGCLMRGLPREIRRRHFETHELGLQAKPVLRLACRFLALRPGERFPSTGMDLVICPRPLPAGAEERTAVLKAYRAALKPGGFFVGERGAVVPARDLPASGPAAQTAGSVALRRERRCLEVFSRSTEAVIVRDLESGAVLEANRAARKLYGWGLDEFRSMDRRSLDAAGIGREPAPYHRRKTGAEFPADVGSAVVTFGRRSARVWLVRDATARTKALLARRQPGERAAVTVERLIGQALDGAGARRVPMDLPLAQTVWSVCRSFLPEMRSRRLGFEVAIDEGVRVVSDPFDLAQILGAALDAAVRRGASGGVVRASATVSAGRCELRVDPGGRGVTFRLSPALEEC